jgi:predicted MFS family arabinose efflux permease
MQTFSLIWFGQLVSLFGTATTRFALLIWAYDQTNQATTVALLGFFSFITYALISPVAGVWVDRMDRRRAMLLADLGAGLMTVALLLLHTTGQLQIWHIYLGAGLTGAFEAFQHPAYAAATTVLVPKAQYARASALRSLASNVSQMLAPIFAGLILHLVDIDGVMLIDVATFGFAMLILLFIRIPRPPMSEEGRAASKASFLHQMSFGFGYIFRRPGLLWLMFLFACLNFVGALTYFSLLAPMILARTGGDALTLASVQTAAGVGGVLGGLLMSVWGGPKRQIQGVLLGAVLAFLPDLAMGAGRSLPVWITAAFLGWLTTPLAIASGQAIWQAKVAPDVQGRVFAVQGMFHTMVMPLGFLVAGPLADQVFGPAMLPGSSLAATFGWLVGAGPGAGIGLMFVCTSVIGITVAVTGYLFPWVRNVERDLPDHEAVGEQQELIAQAA